ncbi:unnamed protein product [Closterium sp. NIES-53]
MAVQELRWLTYLVTNLGEQPCSPPILYVDNKAMIALCQEHRLEHRTTHIALRYFLSRELQQRGQLRLVYMANRANTADICTKALPPGDHQRFSTVLGLRALLLLTGLVTTCSPSLCLWGVSLFDVASGAPTAPPAIADSWTHSQWLTRDAAAHLAIHNHLPLAECAHFGQHRTAQVLYDAVVAPYSSPTTASLGRLLLPYLFPELSTFATMQDLVSHLRASDARYRAAVPAEFLDKNPPPMYITLYFIVTRLPDSLRSVRDHFLSLDPTSLTIDLLEQHLLAAETSAVVVGAARGTPRPPFFEGCSPYPLAPSYASAAAADVSVPEDVGAASTSAKRRNSKGKGSRDGGGGSGSGGGGSGSGGRGSSGGGGGGGTVGGSGGSCGGGGGSGGSGGSRGGRTGAQHWFLRGASGGSCPYVIRTRDGAGQTCGQLHTQHRYFSRLDDAWRAEFGEDVKLPCWADLLKSRIAIFDQDFDAILSAMYASSVNAEGDCYRCVPPDPGIAASALGASESGTLPGTAPAEALHNFTLDSGASRYFIHEGTTLTPLPTPVPVRLVDSSGGPVMAHSSTVLPCPPVPSSSLSGLHLPSFSTNLVSTAALHDAMVTTTTPGGQRVSICTCARTERHLATFTHRPGSSLSGSRLLLVSPPVTPKSSVAPPPGSPLPSSPSWHALSSSYLLSPQVFASPATLTCPALPPLRRGAAARRSSLLHSRERYFLLVVDEYTRYTTVFPLRSKGQVVDVLIPLIHTVRLQLRERFGQDLPVLRLHSDRGAPLESSLPKAPDPESDRARAASPTVSRLLASAVTDPSFESAVASALVAELLDFAAACRLTTPLLLLQSLYLPEDFECLAAAVPRLASMLLAPEGDPDDPDIPNLRSFAEAITGPYSSQWQAAMDAEMASWKSIGTYVDEVPLPGANIVECMWIFRVKRPPGSPPAFKARYVARGFSHRHRVDYF